MVKADRSRGERKPPRKRTKGKWKTRGGRKIPGQARKGLGRPGKNNPHIRDTEHMNRTMFEKIKHHLLMTPTYITMGILLSPFVIVVICLLWLLCWIPVYVLEGVIWNLSGNIGLDLPRWATWSLAIGSVVWITYSWEYASTREA